jgi:hypothetical protein
VSRRFFFHPFFFLIFLVLFIFKENIDQMSIFDLIFPTLMSLVLVFVVYFIVIKITNHQNKSGIITAIFALLFFNYGRIYSFVLRPPSITSSFWIIIGLISFILLTGGMIYFLRIKRFRFQKILGIIFTILLTFFLLIFNRFTIYINLIKPIQNTITHPYIFLIIFSTFFFLFFILIWRTHYPLNEINRGLNTFSVVLVIIIIIQILLGVILTNETYMEKEFPTLPFNVTKATQSTSSYPDVYYIILDGYAGEETLKKIHGFDNSYFLNSLNKKGFYIASNSRSNYLTTVLSLPSSLNMIYLDFLSENPGKESVDRTIPYLMMKQHSLGQNLQKLGYEYIHFASVWNPTGKNSYADVTYGLSQLGEFSYLFLWSTPLRFFLPSRDISTFLYTFDKIPSIAEQNNPTFLFAHITLPHPPYMFDKDGNELSHPPFEPKQWAEIEKYVDQLEYLNKMVIELIDEILINSDEEPIIIIQGDHGTEIVPGWTKNPNKDRIDERSFILNAYYFPSNNENRYGILYDNISPVNTFRIIFNEYFGQEYPLLSDNTYFSDHTTSSNNFAISLYDFILVYEHGKYVGPFLIKEEINNKTFDSNFSSILSPLPNMFVN